MRTQTNKLRTDSPTDPNPVTSTILLLNKPNPTEQSRQYIYEPELISFVPIRLRTPTSLLVPYYYPNRLTTAALPIAIVWNRSSARKEDVAFLTGRITIKPKGRLFLKGEVMLRHCYRP